MGSRFLGRGVLSVESWSAAELVRTCMHVLAGEQVGGARLGVLAGQQLQPSLSKCSAYKQSKVYKLPCLILHLYLLSCGGYDPGFQGNGPSAISCQRATGPFHWSLVPLPWELASQVFPSHQNTSGRMTKRGKCFPWHPPLPDDPLGGPTSHIWSIYFD